MAKKKPPSLKTQAKRLGKAKYAGALSQVANQRTSNRKSYDTASTQRVAQLDSELGSHDAAQEATQKFLDNLKTQSGSIYEQAVAASQKRSTDAQTVRDQQNTSLLSAMQADAIKRGLAPDSTAKLSTELAAQDAVAKSRTDANSDAIQRMGLIAQQDLDQSKIGSVLIGNTMRSKSRGDAQANLDELFRTYQGERSKLEGEEQKLQLEKGDYINQMYMTLKEKAAAKKAAKEQAKLQAKIASGNLAFKNTKLQIDTQYKYDKMASDAKHKSIMAKLKADGLSQKQAKDAADLILKKSANELAWKKYTNPPAGSTSKFAGVQELIASLR